MPLPSSTSNGLRPETGGVPTRHLSGRARQKNWKVEGAQGGGNPVGYL